MKSKYGNQLNTNQRKFVENLVASGKQTESYMEAYDNDNYMGSAASSSRLLKLAKIKKAYEEKMEELKQINVLSIDERKRLLVNEILNSENKTADKVKALDVLNRMEAVYVEKVEADHNISVEIGGNLKSWAE